MLLSIPATEAMVISIMVKGRHCGTMMSLNFNRLRLGIVVPSSSVNLKGMAAKPPTTHSAAAAAKGSPKPPISANHSPAAGPTAIASDWLRPK